MRFLETEMIRLLTLNPWGFLAGARNDMAIRCLWGAELAIRESNCRLSQQLICESPILPPSTPQEYCHPESRFGGMRDLLLANRYYQKQTFKEHSLTFIYSMIH